MCPMAHKVSREYSLELLNTFNTLGFLLRVDEAAKRRLELLSARSVGHATQTRAVPVDLAGFRVERSFLASFLLQSLGIQATFQFVGIRRRGRRLRLGMGDSLLPDLRSNRVEGLV